APAGGQVGGERDEPGRRLVGDGMVARPPALVPPPAVVGRHAQLLAFSLRRNSARSASVARCWLSRAHRSAKSRACAAAFFTSTLGIGPTVRISAGVTGSSSLGGSVTTGGGACPAGGVRVNGPPAARLASRAARRARTSAGLSASPPAPRRRRSRSSLR